MPRRRSRSSRKRSRHSSRSRRRNTRIVTCRFRGDQGDKKVFFIKDKVSNVNVYAVMYDDKKLDEATIRQIYQTGNGSRETYWKSDNVKKDFLHLFRNYSELYVIDTNEAKTLDNCKNYMELWKELKYDYVDNTHFASIFVSILNDEIKARETRRSWSSQQMQENA